MTTQFAILNREAIVLAAGCDRPVNEQDTWARSRRMFSLDPTNQMAIMVWGNDDFAGIPWAMLVDTFKTNVGRKSFKTVADCGTAFMQCLKDKRFRPDGTSATTNPKLILHILEKLRSQIPEEMVASDAEQLRRAACADLVAEIRTHEPIPGAPLPYQFFPQINRKLLKSLAKTMLGTQISSTLLNQIEWAIFETAKRRIPLGSESGIIIAGYGHAEHFPSVQEYVIDGQCGDFTRSWPLDKHSIDGASARAQILDFSATGSLQTHISGIAPAYVNFMGEAYIDLINTMPNYALATNDSSAGGAVFGQTSKCQTESNLQQKFLADLNEFRNREFTLKIFNYVRNLPKNGLIDLASTLIESTSLMTRIFSSTERGGDLVDLAIISREDGFVWVKQQIAGKSLEFVCASESSRASTMAPNSSA